MADTTGCWRRVGDKRSVCVGLTGGRWVRGDLCGGVAVGARRLGDLAELAEDGAVKGMPEEILRTPWGMPEEILRTW
jgi:hypothetical protein